MFYRSSIGDHGLPNWTCFQPSRAKAAYDLLRLSRRDSSKEVGSKVAPVHYSRRPLRRSANHLRELLLKYPVHTCFVSFVYVFHVTVVLPVIFDVSEHSGLVTSYADAGLDFKIYILGI